ncbi:MAG: hypothetical protein AMXMBFR83_02290 [Phycisphaerae bacterium]
MLIVTLVLVFALAGITLALCRSMGVEMVASANYAASLQASAIERGAEQYLLSMLTYQANDLTLVTEDYFAAVPVGDGYFWVPRPDYGDPALPLFGLVGESSKANINLLTFDQLMALPYMTEDVAAAIVDWRDEDEDINPNGGAENEYYLSQANGYYCKNAPFETVEELLLVRGVVPEMLYGNGEPAPLGIETMFMATGLSTLNEVWLERGLYDLLTVYGTEPTTGPDGTQRVSVSDASQRGQLRELLASKLGETRGNEIASALGNGAVVDVFDMYFRARMTADELSAIIDYVTSTPPNSGAASGSASAGGQQQPQPVRGRIDVNTAPREVLLTLDLDSTDVDKLIAQRQGIGLSNDPYNVAWVADALGQKSIGLGNRITGRSYQHSALICAVSGNGRGFKVVRIVIDASGTTPRIVYRRDLTERGWPMEPEILAALRAGQGPGAWGGTSGLMGGRLGGGLR